MIRTIHKASGQTGTSGTTTQVTGNIASTAIKVGTGLATGILSGGATYLIEAITGIFPGGFNMVSTICVKRNDNAAQTAQLYWVKAGDRNDERETNNGFYLIIGLAIIAFTVVLIVNSRKSK